MFTGSTVYVIGGGASLASFDWGLLNGKRCIAVNNAWRKYPAADAMFFGDARFYRNNRDLNPQDDFWRYRGDIFTSLSELRGHSRIRHVDLGKPDWNSGLQAILLAFHLGARDVVLLGFDGHGGRWSDAERYRHQGEVSPSTYQKYIEDSRELGGLPIINANSASAYSHLRTVALESVF